MFWKLFGSEQRVQEALEQSVGYDISPNVLNQTPANDMPSPVIQAEAPQFALWQDYAFVMPANTQEAPRTSQETRERKKA